MSWKAFATQAAVVVFATTAHAQVPEDTPPPSVDEAFVASAEKGLAAGKSVELATERQAKSDPLARSGLTLPAPQVTLETTRGGGRATGTVGVVRERASGETSFLLSMSAPIGTSADAEAHPVDLRGLANGGTVTAAFNSVKLFKIFSAKSIRDSCKEWGIATVDCTAGKLEDSNSDASRKLLDSVFVKVPVLFGASFSYGRNKFSFFDAGGTRQTPVERSDFEAEGSLGFLVNARRDLFALHMAYSKTHSASLDKTQLCRPLAGSPVARCDAAVIGGPAEEKSAIATIEYRWQRNVKIPIAIAPKFQFAFGLDDTADVKSVELPVYFFQEKPDPKSASNAPKLNGGVSAGWRSDTGFQAYVFIGAAFDLFALK